MGGQQADHTHRLLIGSSKPGEQPKLCRWAGVQVEEIPLVVKSQGVVQAAYLIPAGRTVAVSGHLHAGHQDRVVKGQQSFVGGEGNEGKGRRQKKNYPDCR